MRTLLPLSVLLLAAGFSQEKPASSPPARATVVVVPIVGGIDSSTVALLKRAAGHIRARKPDLVLVEIDTPGGEMGAMVRVGEELAKLHPIPTVAFITPSAEGRTMAGAFSAGVYVSISCREIYMAPATSIGASAPIMMTPGGGFEMAPEKFLSAARAQFRARAEQYGYSVNLIQAMVDKDLEIFEVVVDGKKLFLTEGEMEALKTQGKEFAWPKTPYDSKTKLLTLTDREAVAAGLAKPATGRSVIYEERGLVSPVEETVALSWSENLVEFLTSGVVSTILLVVGVIGIWVELKTPGFGAPGVIGVLALALLLFGHHLAGLAEMWEILLVVAGLALLAVELFLLPGTGVFAITGVICILAGMLLSFQDFVIPDVKGSPWQMDAFLSSLGRIAVALMGATVGFLAILRFLPKVPFMNRLVLATELAGTAPAAATGDLTGRQGHAVTTLRPGGKVEVDGQLLDVVAEGEFIAQGEPVEVLRVEGMRVVVGKLKR